MPDFGGIDATRLVLAACPTTRVVALSMHSDRRYVSAMLAAGASGFVVEDGAAAELLDAKLGLRSAAELTKHAAREGLTALER